MNSWLFQGNPRVYDVRGALAALPNQTWSVRQSIREIHAGDEVFFWETGEHGGLLGAGVIESEPAEIPMLSDEPGFVRDKSKFPEGELRVRVSVKKRLPDPIPRALIRNDSRLVDLRNLRFANATNYKLTESQAIALRDLIQQFVASRQLGAPRVFKIAPGEDARFWRQAFAGGYVPVGWPAIGDIRGYGTLDQLRADVEKHYLKTYNGNQGTVTLKARELWLLRELRPGDVVVANRGISEILGVGTVVAPGLDYRPDLEYPHIVHVSWDTSLAGRIADQKAWFARTVAELSPSDVQRILPELAGRLYERVADVRNRNYYIAMLGVEFPGTWETTKRIGQWGAQRADAIGRSVRPGDRAVIRIARQGFKAIVEFTSLMREVETTEETDPWQHAGRKYPFRFDFRLIQEYGTMYNPPFPQGENKELGLKTLQMQRALISIPESTYLLIEEALNTLNSRSAAQDIDEFHLSPGQSIKRTELHDRYGGGRQGGIAPSTVSPNVFLFTDRSSGDQHGYVYDGWEDDSRTVFTYTGEGQRGDQTLTSGNRAILEHKRQGRILRLFEGVRGVVKYLGTVDLADPPFVEREAPETGAGRMRKVIVFRLVPGSGFFIDLGAQAVKAPPQAKSSATQPEIDLEDDQDDGHQPALESTIGDDDPVLSQVLALLEDGFPGVIFAGPPGTSKTWYARQIAAKLAALDPRRVRSVQFHASYQYEDFVEGYVPVSSGGFRLARKHLSLMCQRALGDERLHVLVIDELSRVDPARVFGEALTYIERRGFPFRLASGRTLTIPPNLVFLATMNVFDRGVEDIDAAFERRFARIDMPPKATLLAELLDRNEVEEPLRGDVVRFFEWLQENGNEFARVGHAYFLNVRDDDSLRRLWNHQLRQVLERAYRLDPDGLKAVTSAWRRLITTNATSHAGAPDEVVGEVPVVDDGQMDELTESDDAVADVANTA